jgi:sec-independent protein translocase protein TatA
MPFNLKGPELLILVLVVVLLFGAKRLPDAARSVGRSLRIFKAETKGLIDSEASSAELPGATTSAEQVAAPEVAPAQPSTPEPPAPPNQA